MQVCDLKNHSPRDVSGNLASRLTGFLLSSFIFYGYIQYDTDYRYRSRIADVSSRPSAASIATFQTDELKALIDTSHHLGLKIAAHASTPVAIR